MGKFKVGDRVKLISTGDYLSIKTGETGVIVGESSYQRGDWQVKINGYSLNSSLGFYSDELKLINQFTKSDLKDGMRLTDRESDVYYVCGNRWEQERCCNHLSPDCYTDDLVERLDNCDLDIMKVTDRDGTVLFEREEEPRELTIEEIAKAFNLPVERVRIKK